MARQKRDISEKYNSAFATRLRHLIKERNVTQDALATYIGVTRQTVSQYVNGISDPSFETLGKIADYFNVTTDYLLRRTNDPSPNPSVVDELGLSHKTIDKFRTMTAEEKQVVDDIICSLDCMNLLSLIANCSNSIKSELKFIKSPLAEKSSLNPAFLSENQLADEFLYNELIKQYPFLKDRLYIATGPVVIFKQREEIEKCIKSIIDEITDWNIYRGLFRAQYIMTNDNDFRIVF